jgi:hypothetical protein
VNGALHVAPQLIPAGVLVTVPLPVPVLLMVSVLGGVGSMMNVAVQFRFAVIVTLPSLQSASPLQLPNNDPTAGVAVNTTTWAGENSALQVAPQLIPEDWSSPSPVPAPLLLMIRVLFPLGIPSNTLTLLLPSLKLQDRKRCLH